MSSKPIRWLADEVTAPPFAARVALDVAALLKKVAVGGMLLMPHSRPMPSIGHRCYELRVNDGNRSWRIVYHISVDTVVVLDVFAKKTRATPGQVVNRCKKRLRRYEKER